MLQRPALTRLGLLAVSLKGAGLNNAGDQRQRNGGGWMPVLGGTLAFFH
jgi:hypothetical protein